MRAVLLNTFDVTGGAARAAHRIHAALQRAGAESTLLVRHRRGTDNRTVACVPRAFDRITAALSYADRFPAVLRTRRARAAWSVGWVDSGVVRRVRRLGPDIVNVHWINRGLVSIPALARLPGPLVWTLHDVWPMTGGCHYAAECARYGDACGRCPQLGSDDPGDLSFTTLRRKRAHWKDLDLTVVAPSGWIAECARRSALFRACRTAVIPYGLPTDVFRPGDCLEARRALGLPSDRRIVLIGAVRALDDPRKGFDLLAAAARRLAADGWGERAELVVFGAHGAPGIRNVGLRTTVLGRIGDDAVLARAYAAADVFVAPSREENLAQTVLEALSCGTPCVAFAVGGFPDAIVPGVCGWLARPFEVGDLASCIARVLGDDAARESLSRGARARAVAEFSLERCGRRYVALFEDLLSRPAGMRPSST